MFNLAPHHEDVWGSGGIAPCILNLGTRSGVLYSNNMQVKWIILKF